MTTAFADSIRGSSCRCIGLGMLAALAFSSLAPAHAANQPLPVLRTTDWTPIGTVAKAEIDAGRIPGAVIMIGTEDRTLYFRAFGNRSLKPRPAPMRQDTIFDLASLTKVVATTPAIMQLVEQGKLALDEPVERYWPEFAANGKTEITLRDLLTHYSGLAADLDLSREWSGYETAMAMITAERSTDRPGKRYLYSDINFEILGELVRRVTGVRIDRYVKAHIFAPLGMKDTGFLPSPALRDRIAPTEDTGGHVHWGEVHDATARWMGGVSGHAGLFSTARDLAAYVRALLRDGRRGSIRVLGARSVEEMTAHASPPSGARARGLGWDLGGADGYAGFPEGSYGHLGFTGTMIWIDPSVGVFAIVLTNRVYPDGKGDANPLRKAVIATVIRALGPPQPAP